MVLTSWPAVGTLRRMTYTVRGWNNMPSAGELRRTARVTGLWYLTLAIVGMIGFLLIRPQIFIAGDPSATLVNLVEQESLARLGLVMELALVAAQAMTAVWFYKLFRPFNPNASWALAAFGMVNAIMILASAGFMATALTIASGSPVAAADPTSTIHVLHELSSNAWGVGALFFGLWLIPMGYLAWTSGLMPKWLGWALIAGGSGYLLSAFLSYGWPGAPSMLTEGLTYPAAIGEFWMVGYLLLVGVRYRSDT